MSFVIVIQVSFAPVRPGRYTGRLTVVASPASSQSTHGRSAFLAEVQLTAAADIAAIQVILHNMLLFLIVKYYNNYYTVIHKQRGGTFVIITLENMFDFYDLCIAVSKKNVFTYT